MPSKNYTLTRVTSGEQDLEWDTNTNKYVLSSSLVKPEHLYAYTNQKTLYAWTIEGGSTVNPISCATIYTKTPVLDLNSGVFYDENGVEYDTYPASKIAITNSTTFMTNTHVTEATTEKITMYASDPA